MLSPLPLLLCVLAWPASPTRAAAGESSSVAHEAVAALQVVMN
jgi:hypothetical protein